MDGLSFLLRKFSKGLTLKRKKNLDFIDFEDYVKELVSDIKSTFENEQNILINNAGAGFDIQYWRYLFYRGLGV